MLLLPFSLSKQLISQLNGRSAGIHTVSLNPQLSRPLAAASYLHTFIPSWGGRRPTGDIFLHLGEFTLLGVSQPVVNRAASERTRKERGGGHVFAVKKKKKEVDQENTKKTKEAKRREKGDSSVRYCVAQSLGGRHRFVLNSLLSWQIPRGVRG